MCVYVRFIKIIIIVGPEFICMFQWKVTITYTLQTLILTGDGRNAERPHQETNIMVEAISVCNICV